MSGKYKVAEDIIQRCFDKKMALDTVAFNTFIKAALEAGRFCLLMIYWQALCIKHPIIYVVSGKLQFATTIYDRMIMMGVSRSIQTINTMIRYACTHVCYIMRIIICMNLLCICKFLFLVDNAVCMVVVENWTKL